ncbi:MAG: peptidoglycan-associated lipoprotein Pal [Alphaproteobacteria bacterium]|nr:peptidoglycan-associated lipoprotein Pal [Alphaproteobacteria bacterium]
MKLKVLSLFAALVLVAGCESTSPTAGGAGAGAGGPRPGSQEDLVVNVGDRIFFDYDRSVVRPDQRPTLERQAAWLKQHTGVALMVEGHADERGTREYNLALGQRRANAVRNFLVANGIAPARLQTISYGKDRPACTESNEGCWSQNRRGVSVVR